MANSSISNDLSPLAKAVIESLVSAQKKEAPSKTISLNMVDPIEETKKAESAENDKKDGRSPLVKSIMNVLNGGDNSIERLAFETDPSLNNQYQGLYKTKLRLLPDEVLKRIAIQDDLVAAITNTRANHLATFGRPRPDRFSIGFSIEPEAGVMERLEDDQKKELKTRIDKAVKLLYTCGRTSGWSDTDQLTFSQYLSMSTRNAIIVGRLATEIIYAYDESGQKVFHSFRPIDAGTIYRAAPQKEAAQVLREQALLLLESLKNKKLEPERFSNDEYDWVQVVAGRPVQAFTSEECLVHNFYPVADVELDGYPVTPLDTVIAAVTTHINITSHNKLYFQTGRATRGMLVIKSDDVDEGVVQRIRQQFNASINSVANAWRMPVFGVGAEDEIQWQAIDSGARDMEFQYLSDTNARVILSAFQMSPEELPGYSHLSRGTNSQAMSESNREYLLTAHRDVGIRPLISQFQDFINQRLFPLIDESLSKICKVKLLGLEAETAEKESIRLQQDAPVHMTYDEILAKVEKKPIGPEFGGEFPINPQWQAIVDKYLTVGQIQERFFKMQDASKNPAFQYVRDPFWFQWQQLQMQAQQMQQQAQMQQQQAQQGPPDSGGGGQSQPQGDQSGEAQQQGANIQQGQEESQQAAQQEQQQPGEDLQRSIDEAQQLLLTKGERALSPSKRRILAQHRMTVDHFMKAWEKESQDAIKEILDVAEKHAPKHEK